MGMQQQDAEGLQKLADAWDANGIQRKASTGLVDDLESGGVTANPVSATTSGRAAKKAGCWTQFQMLFRRDWSNFFRDKGSLGARIGSTVFLNIIVAVVFQNSANWDDVADAETAGAVELLTKSREHFGAITQIFISAMFGLAQPALLTFPLERPVFIREYLLGTYGSLPYLFAKVLVDVPVTFAQSGLIFLMTYWIIGFKVNFIVATCLGALLGMVASSLALFIGALSKNVEVAIQLTPLLFVPQLLFAGLFVPLSSIPAWIRWPQYLCFLKYSLNLVLVTEFAYDKANPTYPNGWNTSLPNAMYENAIFGCSGDDLRDDLSCKFEGPAFDAALFPSLDIQPNLFWTYMGILLGSFALFRVASLYCLTKKAQV